MLGVTRPPPVVQLPATCTGWPLPVATGPRAPCHGRGLSGAHSAAGSIESKRDRNRATRGASTPPSALPCPCEPLWHSVAEILDPRLRLGSPHSRPEAGEAVRRLPPRALGRLCRLGLGGGAWGGGQACFPEAAARYPRRPEVLTLLCAPISTCRRGRLPLPRTPRFSLGRLTWCPPPPPLLCTQDSNPGPLLGH